MRKVTKIWMGDLLGQATKNGIGTYLLPEMLQKWDRDLLKELQRWNTGDLLEELQRWNRDLLEELQRWNRGSAGGVTKIGQEIDWKSY